MTVNLFKERFVENPVWILLGDVSSGLEMCEKMFIPPNFIKEEIAYFDTSRDAIDKMYDFFLCCPIKIKVGIFVIKNVNKILISAFLKTFEDIKPNTKIVVIANNLPAVLLSRGVVVKIDSVLPTISFSRLDQIESSVTPLEIVLWFNNELLHFYRLRNISLSQIGYEVREKLVDMQYWHKQGEIDSADAVKVMISLIRCSGIDKYLEEND